jgi:hypothetical protein
LVGWPSEAAKKKKAAAASAAPAQQWPTLGRLCTSLRHQGQPNFGYINPCYAMKDI